MDWITFAIYSFTVIINSTLGLFVYIRNPKAAPNRSLSLFTLSIVGWVVTLYLYYAINDPLIVLFFGRLNFAISIFIAYFFYKFVLVFPNQSYIPPLRLDKILTFLTVLTSILSLFTPLISKNEIVAGSERIVEYGSFYWLFILTFIFNFIFGLYILIHKIRRSKGLVRLQLNYLLLGFGISFSFGITTNILIPLVSNNFNAQVIGPVSTIILIGILTFVIVKHRLLDIKLVLARTITYILLMTTITVFYVIFALGISRYLLGQEITIAQEVVFVILTLIAAVTYSTLRRLLSRFTDKLFFKRSYSPNDILYELSTALNTTVEFNKILEDLFKILHSYLHIKFAVFSLMQKEKRQIEKRNAIYVYGDFTGEFEISHNIDRVLTRIKEATLYDDLESSSMGDDGHVVILKEWMFENNIGAIMPLLVKNEVIGHIFLGIKLTGDAFSLDEVKLLETFALQAAIGIENILLFMHSRDFNERLKLEVSQATEELQNKNKNLEVLRKMDSIIMTTLNPKEMSQKIVDTISWELGYDGALLEIIDYKKSLLVPVAVSKTPLLEKAISLLPRSYEEYVTKLDAKDQLNVQALNLRTKITTTSLADAFKLIPRPIAQSMQAIIGMKGIVIYPILSKDQPLGVLTLALHKDVHDLTAAESNLLDAFMDEVAIALENAYLYEEARSVNQALYESNKELVGLDKMKDEFVSIASHELRTPMTAINGYVWMLLQGKGGALSEKQRYYLERVSQSTQRLINLVNDMLSVSRIESGRVQLDISDFDTVDLVKSVYEELQIKADEKKLGFTYSSTSPEMKAKGDPDKIREVITNLLGNALKFTEKGSITTRVEEKDGFMYIAVTDTGRGVSQEDMPKLFKKFGRLDSSLSTVANTAGTGLGLYICKKYIEAMNGHFEVTSELGKGSTFTFAIPKSS